ncbi:hypothetical protein TNCV_3893191 [Trichonephila clavipes]|nr:hypothetical protein TNCV_3893191 [Trichonephila clavipes]
MEKGKMKPKSRSACENLTETTGVAGHRHPISRCETNRKRAHMFSKVGNCFQNTNTSAQLCSGIIINRTFGFLNINVRSYPCRNNRFQYQIDQYDFLEFSNLINSSFCLMIIYD